MQFQPSVLRCDLINGWNEIFFFRTMSLSKTFTPQNTVLKFRSAASTPLAPSHGRDSEKERVRVALYLPFNHPHFFLFLLLFFFFFFNHWLLLFLSLPSYKSCRTPGKDKERQWNIIWAHRGLKLQKTRAREGERRWQGARGKWG